MPKIKIDQDRCKGCGLCIFYCPKKLIDLGNSLNTQGFYPAVVKEAGKCSGCRFCALICPDCCIEIFST